MKFQKSFFVASACAVLVQPTAPALADGAGNGLTAVDNAPRNSQNFVFNYGPPQDPALNLLNLQASKANISSSPQNFLLSLPGFLNGSTNQNLGLDFTPTWALRDVPPIGDIYAAPSRYTHILYNAQLELAETQGSASTTPSKIQPSGIAIGIYTSLLTDSDPFLSTYNTLTPGQTYDESCLSKYHLSAPSGDITAYDGSLETASQFIQNATRSSPGSQYYVEIWQRVLDVLNSNNGLIYYSNPAAVPHLTLSPSPQTLSTQISKIINDPSPDFTSLVPDLTALGASLDNQRTAYIKTCQQASAIIADAAPDIRFGFGYLESGTPGAFTHLRAGGETEWLAGRYPLPWRPFTNIAKIAADPGKVAGTNGSPSQLTYTLIGGSIQAQQASTLVTGNAKTPIINANIYSGWLGIENDAANYRFSLQAGYTDTFADQAMNKKFGSHGFRWLATAAIQLPDEFNPIVALFNSKAQVWVNSSYGTANGSSTNLNDKTFLLSFTISPPTTVEILQPSS